MPEKVQIPRIPHVIKLGYTLFVDDQVEAWHFKNDDELKQFLHSEFAHAMSSEIAERLKLAVIPEKQSYFQAGKKYTAEFGFIADLDLWMAELHTIFAKFKEEMYLKAMNELRSERHH